MKKINLICFSFLLFLTIITLNSNLAPKSQSTASAEEEFSFSKATKEINNTQVKNNNKESDNNKDNFLRRLLKEWKTVLKKNPLRYTLFL